MNPTDWLYILPAAIFLSLLILYCYFLERQIIYFHISSDNLLDIEYPDYVFNAPFFDTLNKQLESHLVLYVREHFYHIGIPHKYVKVTANVTFDKVCVACYLEVPRTQQKYVQEQSISQVNISEEVQNFYRFIDIVKKPKYEQITKVKNAQPEKYDLIK